MDSLKEKLINKFLNGTIYKETKCFKCKFDKCRKFQEDNLKAMEKIVSVTRAIQ